MSEGTVKFDWNFTLTRNRTDPFRRIGLLGLHNYDARIWEFSVHERFAIRAASGIEDNQEGFLVARNDYHNVKIPITLLITGGSEDGLAGWAIALIVIGSVLVAGAIGFVVYVKVVKKPAYRESETEKSLLEREGELDQKDEDEDSEGSGSSGSGSSGSGSASEG